MAQNVLHSSMGGISSQATGVGNGEKSVSGNQSAVYKTNTLDQYGGMNSSVVQNISAIVGSSVMGVMNDGGHHNRNYTSNQSAHIVARGMNGVNFMNYSILQSELDQENTSMEDMHMFFVAFNHRQNKIIHMLEKSEMVQRANDRSNLLHIDEKKAGSTSTTKYDEPRPTEKGEE